MAGISKDDLRKEITAILKDADLASTSAKKVRQQLEEKLDTNLLSRKKEIDTLVMEYVNSKENNKKKDKRSESEEEEEENEEEEEEGDEEEEGSEEEKGGKRNSTGKTSSAKKTKKGSDSDASEPSEGDSEEEYSPKKAKPPKTRKLPPKKKKGSESDSDEDWGKSKKGQRKSGGAGGTPRKAGSGYTKSMNLSPELAALVGQNSMARHEVVKKIWSIIKERDLYDPKNKQYAICDDALFKVIGVKRFRTFGMMKYLKNHFIS